MAPQAPVAPQNVIGFTGTRHALSPAAVKGLEALLAMPQIRAATGFVTGACIGIDTTVGRMLAERYPRASHRVVVPADRSRISRWWEPYKKRLDLEIFEMPAHTSYRERNLRIVAFSDHLWGFPEQAERAPGATRSGTWQTLRLGRAHHAERPWFWLLNDLENGEWTPQILR